jgi:branched-chain amino acid transport system ATP-binding protein
MPLPIKGLPFALRTSGLSKSFSGLKTVSGVDFYLEVGARQALIGPNGAGKTTFINLLTGSIPPTSGTVWISEENVTPLAAHKRVKRGLARTFQINSLLRELTVLEHVQLAVAEQVGVGGRLVGSQSVQRQTAEAAYDILEQLKLEQSAMLPITELSYGRQRLVEIAIALALKPSVLLLDEPAAGVPPADSHLVFELIEALPSNVSVLFIEHDMKLVARFAERISVLVAGEIVLEGTPNDIASSSLVRDIYLGHRHGHAS